MPSLADVNNGLVFQHVEGVLQKTEAPLAHKRLDLAGALNILRDDVVVRQIISGQFSSPVESCQRAADLHGKIIAMLELLDHHSSSHAETLKRDLKILEAFSLPHTPLPGWSATSCLVVPVVDSEDLGGMVYLRSTLVEELSSRPPRRLHTEDLTRDPRLLDYFDKLPGVLMRELYKLDYYPFDELAGVATHAYRLFFGCQITEGKSVSAALLGMFALVYLRNKLGSDFDRVVAPRPGTLLTGEIDEDGLVRKVEALDKKIQTAANEYGSNLKVIVPADPNLPGEIVRSIDRENLHTVSTVEDLLGILLSNGKDERGLECARQALFRQAGFIERKVQMRPHMKRGVASAFLDDPRTPAGPRQHEHNIFSDCRGWNHRLDLTVATDPAGLRSEQHASDKTLIEVLLDGSRAMTGHWEPDSKTGISRMTAALFSIAERINTSREDLVMGFLSSDCFEPVPPGVSAEELEKRLQRFRHEQNLERRGTFMRPTVQASRRIYRDHRKRIFVLSDTHIPDIGDMDDFGVESSEQFRLSFTPGGLRSLYSKTGSIDAALLSACFWRYTARLPKLKLDCGTQMPVAWEPVNGSLGLEDGRCVISWENPDAINWKVRVLFPESHPHQIGVKVEVDRNGTTATAKFVEHPAKASLAALDQVRQGTLSEAESANWQDICTTGCPSCGRHHVHMLHRSPVHVHPQLIFTSINGVGMGWLLLADSASQWTFFQTGHHLNAIAAVAVVDGRLQYSRARGFVEPVPVSPEEPGLYFLDVSGTKYYFTHLR